MLNHFSYGTGSKTLVLLHGFCENNTCFDFQVDELQKHFRVITFDLPGFGLSEPIAGITFNELAKKIKTSLDELQIKQCVMIGHSMGGYATLAFAKMFPHQLKAFGLLHSTAVDDNDERKEKRKQVINFLQQNGIEIFLKNFIPTLFFDKIKNQNTIHFMISEAMKSLLDGFINACHAMISRENNLNLLATTDLPVFFGIGKHDAFINEIDLLNQASLCRQSEICLLDSSAHCSMYEEPEKLNAAIYNFVDRVG